MTKLKTDHALLKKRAVELWERRLSLCRELSQADREVTNLQNAWSGDDELHFFTRWQGTKAESSVLSKTVHGLSAYSEHLMFAARTYREAQIDSVNAALELVR